jgi:hypothetical protein
MKSLSWEKISILALSQSLGGRVPPEENTVTLIKMEAPRRSFSGPSNMAISWSFWREMWPWPSETCSWEDRRRWLLGGVMGGGWRGGKRGVSQFGHLHSLQRALDGDTAGVHLHSKDDQGMSVHWLVEYIPGGQTVTLLAAEVAPRISLGSFRRGTGGPWNLRWLCRQCTRAWEVTNMSWGPCNLTRW